MPSLPALPPAVVVHLVLALGAVALGPLALFARKGSALHRASGYAWVALMLGTALSSAFLRDFRLPNIGGYTPIHLFAVVTFIGIGSALYGVARGRMSLHRRAMAATYFGGCIGAGVFALVPGRMLGNLVWGHALGLI